MTIYFFMYGIIAATAIFCRCMQNDTEKLIKKKKKLSFWVCFAVITLMLGLRHPSMGIDLRYLTSYGYLGRFDYISELSLKDAFGIEVANYERGYIVFNKLVSLIKSDRQFFLLVCAVFSILPIAFCIYKNSCSPVLSFVIYLGLPAFLMCYSALRQAIAIALCFYSVGFIKDKKKVKFALSVLLAITFHRTAFIFLFAYPLYHIQFKRSLRWASVAAIPVVFLLRNPLFKVLSKLFKEDAVADNNNAITLFLVFFLVYIFCIIYSDFSNEQNGLLNLFFAACVCQAFGGVYNTAIRVGYYFMLPLCLLLPAVLKNISAEIERRFFYATVALCFGIFGLYSIYTSSWPMAYPYYFFWEGVVI